MFHIKETIMVFSQYAKWRLAGIAAVLVFLLLPGGMDVWIRLLFSVGLGSTPLWVLPSGGIEPADRGEDLTLEELFLGWPMLCIYALLGTFIWWMAGVWWSFLLVAVLLVVLAILVIMFKGSINMMEGTHNTCM